MSPPPRRPAHINADGKRIKFYPLEITGKFIQNRRIVGYILILILLITPWINWGGIPLVQFNPDYRRLSLFGHYYFPTDLSLIVTALIAGVIAIVALTARWGRVWCGWTCPQTVLLHWIAEPIERFLEGNAITRKRKDAQGNSDIVIRRAIRYFIMALISIYLGHTLLAYFAGTERTFFGYWQNPADYPATTFFALFFSVGIFADLVIIKEVFCTVICPYARLQGVLVDTQTLQVRYKEERGEPRVQRKKSASDVFGDCLNCDLCHKVCPTGIDIRDGYQLECIGCARCVDACDSVMKRAGKEPGLVSYNRIQEIKGGHKRTWVYLFIITILLAVTAYRFNGRGDFKVDWVRNGSTPFIVKGDSILNMYTVRLRSTVPQDQNLHFPDMPGLSHNLENKSFLLKAGEEANVQILIHVPKKTFKRGNAELNVQVGKVGDLKSKSLHFVGPW